MNARQTSLITLVTGILLATALGLHFGGLHEWRQWILISATVLAEQVEEQKSKRLTLPMSRKDLASHLGTSPETISRKLAEFEDAGWIKQTTQRNIQIVDLDALLLT